MKLILAEDIASLGRMGDIVDVANGYARNFLLPHKKGLLVLPRHVKAFDHQKRLIALKAKKVRHSAEMQAQKLVGASVSIPVRVGEQGQLFGSVTARDITDALATQGFSLDRRQILLEKPIKELGTVAVSVKVHHDLVVSISVCVTGDAAETSLGSETSVGAEETRPASEDLRSS